MPDKQPYEETIIYLTPAEQRMMLEKLCVPRAILVLAAQTGFAERANADEFDPVTAAGTDAWRYPTRIVRSGLYDLGGWRLDNPKNLPLVINDSVGVNITVCSGDQNTGSTWKKPKTKHPKGALIETAIERNVRQGLLFPELEPENVVKFEKTLEYPTWVFLLHITEEEIRAELSLPRSLDGDSRIDDWSHRIILDIVPPDTLYEDVEPDDGPDIEPKIISKI